MKFEPLRLTLWYNRKNPWRHPYIKLLAILRICNIQDNLRMRCVAWRVLVLRFPRWPWLQWYPEMAEMPDPFVDPFAEPPNAV